MSAIRARQHPDEYVKEGMYCKLMRNGEIFMSDTDMEKDTNREFIYHAHGRILIGGLGIGLIILAIQDKQNVAEMVVVEKYREVIDLVKPHLPLNDKVKIVCADAFDYMPEGVFNVIYMDIWPDICTDNKEQYMKLARRYGRCLDKTDPDAWHSAWCKRRIYEKKKWYDR